MHKNFRRADLFHPLPQIRVSVNEFLLFVGTVDRVVSKLSDVIVVVVVVVVVIVIIMVADRPRALKVTAVTMTLIWHFITARSHRTASTFCRLQPRL